MLIDDHWNPWAWCDREGIRVDTAVLPADRFGEWHPAQRLIVIGRRLTALQERDTLTHECGHAALHHVGCLPRQESRANEWAAERLIRADAYARAEHLYGTDLAAVATELGVMRWVVDAWRSCQLKLRRWDDYFAGAEMIA